MAARPAGSSRARALLRRLTPGVAGRWAIALIALGALIRLGLLLLGWPKSDSDEATMGLMALHINAHSEWPLFFDGQSYMGTLQAYLGAALFHVFGASVFSLRLGLLLLYVLFLLVMYPLLRLLYGQSFALVGLLLLDLGGPDLLRPQLLALGGYPETLLFGALSLLLVMWLALGLGVSARRPGWWRLALYGALGLTMGVGWWSDQLVFPFLVTAALLLVVFCRHELAWRGLIALIAGLLIGLLPQFIYLIVQPAADGPSAVAAFEWQGMSTLTRLPGTFGAHILGALLVALPNITGIGWLCAAPTLPNGALADPANAGALVCLGLRAGWSVGLLALGGIAALATWQALRAYPRLRQVERWPQPERVAALKLCGRLALLLGGALTLAFYLVSPAAATPAGNARYLVEMDIALPAIVYPLWMISAVPSLRGAVFTVISTVVSQRTLWLRRASLALLTILLIGGVVSTYGASSAARASSRADQSLIRDLERLGVHHMHTDYWTCDKVAFLSQERITCDALKATLVEGFNRYPPYVAQVAADPRAAYVFPASLPQAAALAQKARDPAWPYTLTRMDGYVVWLRR
jgi:hypothetical protein